MCEGAAGEARMPCSKQDRRPEKELLEAISERGSRGTMRPSPERREGRLNLAPIGIYRADTARASARSVAAGDVVTS
jgi:hypothetical protein